MDNIKKYSTRLPQSLIYKLRLHCLMREMSAESILRVAIEKYLLEWEIHGDATITVIRRNSGNAAYS